MASNAPGRLIVGADGTAPSVRAVGWALDQACTTGNVVDVVTAWQSEARLAMAPLTAGAAAGEAVALMAGTQDDDVLAAQARLTAERAVRVAAGGEPSVPVRVWAMRGRPADVLCDLAGPDDLLVVGPTGHRAVVGALLGSVASYLISNAPCPVVVVRRDEAQADAGPPQQAHAN